VFTPSFRIHAVSSLCRITKPSYLYLTPGLIINNYFCKWVNIKYNLSCITMSHLQLSLFTHITCMTNKHLEWSIMSKLKCKSFINKQEFKSKTQQQFTQNHVRKHSFHKTILKHTTINLCDLRFQIIKNYMKDTQLEIISQTQNN
jgi:hypothetical protein